MAPAATSAGPAAWERAYQTFVGEEPARPKAPEVQAPWPECATTLVRAPLAAEMARREKAANAAHRVALDAWTAARRTWVARRAAVDSALSMPGLALTPPGEERTLAKPVSAGKAADLVPVARPETAEARALRQALAAGAVLQCVVRDVTALPRSVAVAALAAAVGQPLGDVDAWLVLCATSEAKDADQYLVAVPARAIWATLQTNGAKATVTAWHVEEDRALAPELRGRVATLARGAVLAISAPTALERYARMANPGFDREVWESAWGDDDARRPVWVATHMRRCRHEGLGCPLFDGALEPTVRPAGGAVCADDLRGHLADLRAAITAEKAGSPVARTLLAQAAVLAPDDKGLKRLLGDAARAGKRTDEAIQRYTEAGAGEALAALGESLAGAKATLPQAIRALEAAVVIDPANALWLVRLGGLLAERGDTVAATTRLEAAATAAKVPGPASEAAALLDYLGQKDQAAAARKRACELGDKASCR